MNLIQNPGSGRKVVYVSRGEQASKVFRLSLVADPCNMNGNKSPVSVTCPGGNFVLK